MRHLRTVEQPLTRTLCTLWVGVRALWFDHRVEIPVRAFDPDGLWRGRTATPTPRTYSARVTDWAAFESSRTGRSVRGSELLGTRTAVPAAQVVESAAKELQRWRRQGRIALGPFAQPDSQDAFHIFVTRELLGG